MTTTVLNTVGGATAPLAVLARESVTYAFTADSFDGKAWVQKRLNAAGDWRNVYRAEPGTSVNVDGPGEFRVWVESLELADELTVEATENDDVLWRVPRANGVPALEVTKRGIGATFLSYLTGTVGGFLDSLQTPVGAGLVGWTLGVTGATSRLVRDKLRDLPVHVKDFGAVGDGTTDDLAALTACIDYCHANGRTIDWGDDSCVYRITGTLTRDNGSDGFRWVSSGASIVLDSATVQRYAVYFPITGGDISILGKLVIDANRLAHRGFYVSNASDGSSDAHYGDFTAVDLTVRNAYRASSAYSGGDGIMLLGAFDRVTFDRPSARNIAMASGAGVMGSQGVAGITISNNGAAAFRYLSITDPDVDGVYSEDDAYTYDMDAIRVFDGGDDAAQLYPWETFAEIRGGKLKNSWGRSIKVQANYARVSGTKFVRTEGNSTGIGNPEIDFQVGGGSVSDIEFLYDGSVPSVIFQGSSSSVAGKQTPIFRVRGISGVVTTSSPQMTAVVAVSGSSTGDKSAKLIASGIDVDGADAAQYIVRIRTHGDDNLAALSDIVADPADALVSLWGFGTTASTTNVSASRCVNTGADVDFVYRDGQVNFVIIASADGCIGFNSAKTFSSTGGGVHPPIARLDAIASNKHYGGNGTTGLIRPMSNALADGAEWLLPETAISLQSCLLLVSVGAGRTQQGIFACAANGVDKVTGIGTDWTVGTTSDPGAGNWRIWGTSGGIVIKNASGTNRQVTVLAIG